MKVKELIERLKEAEDENAEVIINIGTGSKGYSSYHDIYLAEESTTWSADSDDDDEEDGKIELFEIWLSENQGWFEALGLI